MNERVYFYVFVRQDIPLADQICQVAHASAVAGKKYQIPDEAFLVLLHVDDEKALIEAADRLERHDISFSKVFEPDDDLGYTALCTQAITQVQRGLLRDYGLWRQENLVLN